MTVAPGSGSDEPVRMTSHHHVTAVIGASGGLGASTLALAVGRRLAATGPPAVVVDLDLLRGGLEVTAGIEHLPGRRWDDLRHVRGRVPPESLLPVLPGEEGCAVLSARGGAPAGVPEAAARDVVAALAAGPARVVLDLPLSSPVLPHVLAARRRWSSCSSGCAPGPWPTRMPRCPASSTARRRPPCRPTCASSPGAGAPAPTSSTRWSPTSGSPTCTTSPTTRTCRATPNAGLFPGTGRDGIRRCADAVVAAVDAVAVAS